MNNEALEIQQREEAAQNPFEAPTPTALPTQNQDLNNMSLPMKIMSDMKAKEQQDQLAQYLPEQVPEPVKINPVTETREIPLREQATDVLTMNAGPTPFLKDSMRHIPAETVLFRLVLKPQYTLNSIKNSKGVEGQWFYITTRYAESEVLNNWRDYLLQKYVVDQEIEIPNEYYLDKLPVNYSEIKPTEQSAKVFIPETSFNKIQLVEMYMFPVQLLRDIYIIKARRFVNLPKGVALYSADDEVITTPRIAEDSVGCYFYTTRVLVEDYVLQQWRDMVLNVYYINKPITVPFGKNNERDKAFDGKYGTYAQIEGSNGETLLTSYFDDNIIGKYLQNEEATGELFLTEEDLSNVGYYGSFPIKLEDLKYIHGIQNQML